ncbi:uncharacterized protein ARB_06292 [Trichophyton benhamiae CBS 112371]|uniref:Uncharacterized protein n=1 Tax=Arthroderma benhamiae (strain ATCC MYA-4681 / CBS 112371) TaxID=663331 RepID=D4APY5_ARTBC|nr:uncharacterized protein ARB_06292 [Trichophyton benhamiae CBS 112371]EFE34529.1 hypothetical protein ARB_06292 [Trichophyton benhamiae CBS 112371]
MQQDVDARRNGAENSSGREGRDASLPACLLLAGLLVCCAGAGVDVAFLFDAAARATRKVDGALAASGRAGLFACSKGREEKKKKKKKKQRSTTFLSAATGGFFLLFRIPLMLLAARFQLRLRVCLVDSRVTSLAGL